MTDVNSQPRGSAMTGTMASVLGWIELGLLGFGAGMLFIVFTQVDPSAPAFGVILVVTVVLLVLAGASELLRRRIRR